MANFLLVHGAWQGAWVWPAVAAGLTMRGHQVHTLDLPGNGHCNSGGNGSETASGSKNVAPDQITLPLYTEAIVKAIEKIGKPVTLVGHSMGGIPVTAAAEIVSEKLARIIYLCAFVPRDGDSLKSLSELLPAAKSSTVEMTGNGICISTMPATRVETYMHDAPWSVSSWAASQYQPQAIMPFMTPVQISEERYGRVPRSYIVCTNDKAVDPALQRVMARRAGCMRIKELPASHSPFLSDPTGTAEVFHRLVTEQ